jgi:hypothetical protein
MAKAVKYSAVASEIKKEYLREHLEEIKKLISSWMKYLNAPEPLAPDKGIWGWQSVYNPTNALDPDNSHMLRHHLRSRALWSHHYRWQRGLEGIWHLTEKVREEAKTELNQRSIKRHREYTPEYTKIALWKAFDAAIKKPKDDPNKWYKVPETKKGLSYGAYAIELTATSSEERSSIAAEHRKFITYLTKLKAMKQLVGSWRVVVELQSQMLTIASKKLKSGDILHVCMFCRHLWK